MLHVGCAVWAYDGWAENFFPPRLPKDERLKAYAERLTAVEANNTFYAIPTLAAVRNWAEQTPESFRFSPKYPRTITHTAQLKDVAAQTGSFIGVMRLLGQRLGPLMLQLPPSFGPVRLPVLRAYLATQPEDIQIVVEVRHPDWFTGDNGAKLDEVLVANRAARVIFDPRPAHKSESPEADPAKERKPNVPVIAEAMQGFVVIRYISSPVVAENEPYLNEWAERCAVWLKEKREVYFYAHCPVEERSPDIARDFYHRVSALTKLPALPWDKLDQKKPSQGPEGQQGLKQLSLFDL